MPITSMPPREVQDQINKIYSLKTAFLKEMAGLGKHTLREDVLTSQQEIIEAIRDIANSYPSQSRNYRHLEPYVHRAVEEISQKAQETVNKLGASHQPEIRTLASTATEEKSTPYQKVTLEPIRNPGGRKQ
jgi:hypothetical protein